MPDINVLTQESSEDPNIKYLENKQSYIENTITESYNYIRNKLENISNIESAWNFLKSDNNFLAIFCALISLFLDIASFLIGLFIHYYNTNNRNKKTL